MRLARFHTGDGTPRIGAVTGGEIADLTGADPSLTSAGVAELLMPENRARVEEAATGAVRHPLDQVTLLAPIPAPPTFVAIGLNYADHIRETGRAAPTFPMFFNKQTTCVIGPGAAIELPQISDMVDFEGELAIVIGRRCRNVPAGRAPEVVAGYTIVNDVSVRDWQQRSPTMTLGKSFDTHGPIGPHVVSGDELDPHDLRLRTWVDDELMQDGHTGDMIVDCWRQIEVLSSVFTLRPGDVIATGTPAGVGVARTPPVFLRAGDVVRIEIEGIGTLENPVIDEPERPPAW